MTELPNGPAVYAFENMDDGKIYIGSSVNAHRRVQHHLYLLRRGKHHNRYLQRAYEKHHGKFRVFVLEVIADCDAQGLWKIEQRWISTLATTEPEHGYNIHPTPIAPDYPDYIPAAASKRLRDTLRPRRRGVLTEPGRIAQDRARRLAWQRPGEREYRGEIMRDIWATPEHRGKIVASIADQRADPEQLEAMRARCAAMRASSSEKRSEGVAKVSWRRHASDKFPSDAAMTDWIVAQYKTGMSARQIGLTLGMAHNAVVHRLKKRDVAVPERGAGRHNIATSATYLARKGIDDLHEFDRQVAALRAEGNSINAIRTVYGLSADAVRNSLRRSQDLDVLAEVAS